MALIAHGYPSKPKSKDLLITLFNELTDEYPEYKEFIPELTEESIRNVLDKINMKVRSQTIIDFVMSRYNSIK